jgi:hypothetical protein
LTEAEQDVVEFPRRPLAEIGGESTAEAVALLDVRAGAAWCEVHPGGRRELAPAAWIGEGDGEAFAARTATAPPVRIHAFAESPFALGSGGLVNGGVFVELPYVGFCETSRFAEHENRALVAGGSVAGIALRMPPNEVVIEGDCALLLQQGDRHWGHLLVDVVPRLLLLRKHFPTMPVVVSGALPAMTALLALAGEAPGNLVVVDPATTRVRAGRMFVPSFPRFANGFSPLARHLFTAIHPLPRVRQRRIYVSRAGTRLGSTISNHEDVESAFAARGFEIVRPESMDVATQAALFAQASHVAGEYGSALHNTVFSAQGTRVLCLQSAGVAQFVQAGIGAVLDQPTGFAFGVVDQGLTDGRQVPPSHRERCFALDRRRLDEGLDWLLAT